MTPPDPTRIVFVPPATYPISTDVAELAIPSILWCSASQNRVYPHLSACLARSSVLRKLSAASPPSFTEHKSRIEYRATLLWMLRRAAGLQGSHQSRIRARILRMGNIQLPVFKVQKDTFSDWCWSFHDSVGSPDRRASGALLLILGTVCSFKFRPVNS